MGKVTFLNIKTGVHLFSAIFGERTPFSALFDTKTLFLALGGDRVAGNIL